MPSRLLYIASFFCTHSICCAATNGASITFSDEVEFLATAGEVTVEHFETLDGKSTDFNPIHTTFFTLDPTLIADGLAVKTDGVGATDGTDNWSEMAPLTVGDPAGILLINFLSPTTVMGISVFDWGDL